MTRKQQRIYAIIVIMLGIIIAASLSLCALRDKVTFFYAPSDIVGEDKRDINLDRPFRMGGLVVYGTLDKEGAKTKFVITDNKNDITVFYEGILPNLFREGQGIIALGTLNEDGIFIADELLAKHDENYMPPEVAKALKKTHQELP